MKKWWRNTKAWAHRQWVRFRTWFGGLLMSLGLMVSVSMADNVNLSWTNATQWDNGTALAVADLEATIIYKQSFPLEGTGMADPRNYTELDRVAPTVTSYVDANQPNGVHCYVATHLAKNGQESPQSNESCKTVDVRIPGGPSNLKAN